MEILKTLPKILEADDRNLLFVRMDTGKPLSLETHHSRVAAATLDSTVPEEVRSYFTTVQNLYIYAWFAYDLYAIGQGLCFAAMEMALRLRLPVPNKDGRGLSNLLEEAVSKKLISEKGFTHMRNMRHLKAERLRADREMLKYFGQYPKTGTVLPKSDYGKVLAKVIPSLRNAFAHPRNHAVIMPGEALLQLHITAEFINQLFTP